MPTQHPEMSETPMAITQPLKKRSEKELNNIWSHIEKGTYKDIAKKFPGAAHPRKLIADPSEQVMSIPHLNGGQDLWRRNRPKGKWEIL
jgi:hypothetical protein